MEREGGGKQAAANEDLRKEVEELKRWREVCLAGGRTRGEEATEKERQEPKEVLTARKQEERNWKGLEWITEEKEREKRKNNIIIVGLDAKKRYTAEDIVEWLKKEIEVEAKIEKVWRVRTLSGKFLLGALCGSDKDKREVMVNKKKLGDKEVYIENDLTWSERKIKERA